ncbi:MAG TPA: type IV pilin [Thermoplasmata archaeon]|nr:type IV pilin [Thermoplasmata archaeon]
MKKIWTVRKDTEAVSPVIATILMVAITVVLAAVLYVMVLGFGTDTSQTPTTTLTDTTITSGVKLTFGAVNAEISWADISFLISDGTYSAGWNNLTTAMLSGGLGDTQNLGTTNTAFGTLVVTMVIQDLSGNGKADQGDNIKLTATSFSASVDYVFTAIYEPTDGNMAEATFSG